MEYPLQNSYKSKQNSIAFHSVDTVIMYSLFKWLRAGSVFAAWNFLLLWFTDPLPTIALIVLFMNQSLWTLEPHNGSPALTW